MYYFYNKEKLFKELIWQQCENQIGDKTRSTEKIWKDIGATQEIDDEHLSREYRKEIDGYKRYFRKQCQRGLVTYGD